MSELSSGELTRVKLSNRASQIRAKFKSRQEQMIKLVAQIIILQFPSFCKNWVKRSLLTINKSSINNISSIVKTELEYS